MIPLRFALFLLAFPGLAGCAQSGNDHQPPTFPAAVVPWREDLYHGTFANAEIEATALLLEFTLQNSSRIFVNSSVDGHWDSTKGVWILQQLHAFTPEGYVDQELGSTLALPSCMNRVPAGTTSLANCDPRNDWDELQGSKYGSILNPGRYTVLASAFGASTAKIAIELWLNFTPSAVKVTETTTGLHWGTSWPSSDSHQSVQFTLDRPSLVGTRGARSGQFLQVDYASANETRTFETFGRGWTLPGLYAVPNTHAILAAGTWNATVELDPSPGEANGVLLGTLDWTPTPA